MIQQHMDLSLKAGVERGFTQDTLVEKLGVSKRTIIRWENREVEIIPYVIYSLAHVFQMDSVRVPDQK